MVFEGGGPARCNVIASTGVLVAPFLGRVSSGEFAVAHVARRFQGTAQWWNAPVRTIPVLRPQLSCVTLISE